MPECVSVRPFHLRCFKNDYENRVDMASKRHFVATGPDFVGLSHVRNPHEEADVIIIHQMLSIVASSTNDINISVISDNTNVFDCCSTFTMTYSLLAM